MPESHNADLIRRFWDRISARDWAAVRLLVADDLLCEWPHSAERFTSGDAWVEMNRIFPEGWSIEVQRIVDGDDLVISEVRVPFNGSVDYAITFFAFRDGLISRMREYWLTARSQEPPAWRAHLAEPMPNV